MCKGVMLRRFFSYYKPHKRLFIVDFTSAVIVATLELAFPVAVQYFIDDLLPGNDWDLIVLVFGVSHDAVAPMFYTFHHQGKKVALVTDLGYVSDRIKKTVEGADAYIFEANHDVGMLRMGKYPWNVKRRMALPSIY